MKKRRQPLKHRVKNETFQRCPPYRRFAFMFDGAARESSLWAKKQDAGEGWRTSIMNADLQRNHPCAVAHHAA
jgi:hypothetical protein